MRILLSLLLLFIGTLLSAQSIIIIPTEMEFVAVQEVPKKRLPKGVKYVEFAYRYEPAILYFGYHVSEEKFQVIGQFTEDTWFNQAKSNATMHGDTIVLWSQYPFRASEVTYTFVWKGKSIRRIATESRDPSEESITLAEEALKKGNIKEAIEHYYEVQYPSSYMNEDRVGMEILSKANEMGLISFKEKNYSKSVGYIQDALEYYTLSNYTNASTEFDIINAFENSYLSEYRDSFGLWMGNYGYFLYKADSLEKSIETNAWLNKVYPQLSGPYLQRGDALYDLNRQKEAIPIYLQYIALMKEKGKEKSIPERAIKRSH